MLALTDNNVVYVGDDIVADADVYIDIDRERHRVRCGAGWSRLKPHPWRAFEQLLQRRGHVVYHDELLAAVWRGRIPNSEHILRQLICDLRRQLRGSRFGVVTWNSLGYEIEILTAGAAD